MTLLVSSGCRDFVIQVSDRRFIKVFPNGTTELATDEGNKELVIRSPTLTAAVTFTGLAEVNGQPLGDWLLDVVSADDAEAGLDTVLCAILDASNRKLRHPHGRHVPQTFIVTGFTLPDGIPRSARITNCDDPKFRDVAGAAFTIERSERSDFFWVAGGCYQALPRNAEALTKEATRKRRGYPTVVDGVVAQIRAAHGHSKLGKFIGENCMSICIMADGTVESVYFPKHRNPVTYGPNVLEAFASQGKGAMMFRGIEGTTSPGMELLVGTQGLRVRDRRLLTRRNNPQR